MQKSSFIMKHLSALAFITIYVVYAVYHVIADTFLLTDQLGLLFVMLPFILIGLALDYILSNNQELEQWIKVIAKLLPLGVFVMQIISTIYLYQEEELSIFNYMIWLFVAAPFFIASYTRENVQRRVYLSGIGTGAFLVVYLFLATQTDAIDSGYGSIAYFAAYFMIMFAVTGRKRFPYLTVVISVINAVVLLFRRYVPTTRDTKLYGWDYNLNAVIELLIIITFSLCISFYVIDTILNSRKKTE